MKRLFAILLFAGCITAKAQQPKQEYYSLLMSSSTFDSSTVSNIVGWWKADYGITLNGSNVATWQSVTYNTGVFGYPTFGNSGSGSQPLFVSNVYNGWPTVRFNNKLFWMSINNENNYYNSLTAVSIFIVGKNSVADDGNLLGTYNGSGWMVYANGNHFYGAGRVGLSSTPSITPNSSSLVLMEVVVGPGQEKTYANGTLTNSLSGAALTQGTGLTIGRYSGNSTRGVSGYDVSEIIIYNRELTDTERAKVETYLKSKYGL